MNYNTERELYEDFDDYEEDYDYYEGEEIFYRE